MGKWNDWLGRALRRLLAVLLEHGEDKKDEGDGAPDARPGPTPPSEEGGDDEVPFGELRWSWGGFDGSRAARENGCAIKHLKVHGGRMSYSWQRGGCENLGASDASDADCLACLFCRIGGKWQGGKFEWISTSRRTRGLGNIRGGYGGWRPDACEIAGGYAFCIVSRDRRKRTNVIMCERGE